MAASRWSLAPVTGRSRVWKLRLENHENDGLWARPSDGDQLHHTHRGPYQSASKHHGEFAEGLLRVALIFVALVCFRFFSVGEE